MSDQDFFFEDEERPAEDAAPAKGSGKSGGSKGGAKAGGAPAPVAQQSVSVTVAALVAVCALLVGVIIGLVVPRQGTVSGGTGSSGIGSAPQLTQEEIQTGKLPAGHPDISGMGGDMRGSGTATGSKTTTK